MKKITALIATVSLCIMILASCSGGAGSSKIDVSPIAGDWQVRGIMYNNWLIDISDLEDLEDLYDGYRLTINEDGTFVYTISVFGYKGSVKFIDESDTSRVLMDTEETFTYEYENGELVQKPSTDEGTPKKFIGVLLDASTMEVAEYDPVMQQAASGAEPYYFAKSGEDSPYLAENKHPISTDGSKSNAGSSSTAAADTNSSSGTTGKSTLSGGGTYQAILDEYTAKMERAVPGLVSEYKSEASGTSDISRLAEICNNKVEKLAEICNEGVGKMAELMQKNGDSYDTYETWAGKLMDNYTDIANEIQDAYLDSAM